MAKEVTTIRGMCQESKAGYMVDGVLIEPQDLPDAHKLLGRTVEVTGTLVDSPWSPVSEDGLPQQGFEGKVMRDVSSVKLVPEDETFYT